jgi:hypothetical protein
MANLNTIHPQSISNSNSNSLLPTVKLCSLDEAISYQNEEVIYRFINTYDISFEEANDIFMETKKWLWLCAQPDIEELSMTEAFFAIDEMWHTFIVFTPEYTDYCWKYFDQYIHHLPTTQREKDEIRRLQEEDPVLAMEKHNQERLQQYAVIYDKLGAETLLKWFVEYPTRYSEELLTQRRKAKSFNSKPTPELEALAAYLQAGKKVVLKKN